MADELVFSGGEIVYTMPQLPKVASVPLNGSAVLVGFKDAPDGEEVLFDFDPRAEKATKLDYELAAVSGLLTGALNILWQKDFNLEGAKEWGDEKVGKFVLTIAKSAGMTKGGCNSRRRYSLSRERVSSCRGQADCRVWRRAPTSSAGFLAPPELGWPCVFDPLAIHVQRLWHRYGRPVCRL